jgi:hypothetical protein
MQVQRINDLLSRDDHGLDLSLKPKDIVKLPVRERQKYFSLNRMVLESWSSHSFLEFEGMDPKPVPDQVSVKSKYYLGNKIIGYSDLYVFPIHRTIYFEHFSPMDVYGKKLWKHKIGSLARLSTLIMLIEDSIANLDYLMGHPSGLSKEISGMLNHMDLGTSPLNDYLKKMVTYANDTGYKFEMPTQDKQPYEGRPLLETQSHMGIFRPVHEAKH